jgi:hypothetical protein
MTVEMHGVCSGSGVVYNDADRGVATEVLDVPLCGVRKVALVSEKENRVVVVGAEGLAAQGPKEASCVVDVEVYIEVLGSCWSWWCDGIVRNCEGEVIVGTGSGVRNIPSGAGGSFGLVCFVVEYYR